MIARQLTTFLPAPPRRNNDHDYDHDHDDDHEE